MRGRLRKQNDQSRGVSPRSCRRHEFGPAVRPGRHGPALIGQLTIGTVLNDDSKSPPELIEGIDYYIESGRWVFTAAYLRRRGTCCEFGCRHCPYRPTSPARKLPQDDSPTRQA
jgi:hypothetical protein